MKDHLGSVVEVGVEVVESSGCLGRAEGEGGGGRRAMVRGQIDCLFSWPFSGCFLAAKSITRKGGRGEGVD